MTGPEPVEPTEPRVLKMREDEEEFRQKLLDSLDRIHTTFQEFGTTVSEFTERFNKMIEINEQNIRNIAEKQ